MTGETMQLALEMLDETRPVDIGFFGGEPLLYLGALEEATELAVKLSLARKVASKFHLTTNATLITEYAATFLRDQGFTVLVSLDGPADLHNKHRGGHAETMRGLLLLKAAGVCQVMARATYVPDAISLRRRAEYLYGLQKRGLIKAFSIEPASGQTWDGEVLSQEYGELGNWYVEQIKAGERPDFFHFRVFLQRLRDAQPHLCSCGAGNSYITIGPDGTLYACHRQGSSEIGHVKVGFDETKRNEWLDGRLFNHQDCCDCWAKFVCGGGCREAHCQETGWRDCPGSSCVPTRAMIMESMWVLSKLSEK